MMMDECEKMLLVKKTSVDHIHSLTCLPRTLPVELKWISTDPL